MLDALRSAPEIYHPDVKRGTDAAESFIRCLVSNDAAGDRQRFGFV